MIYLSDECVAMVLAGGSGSRLGTLTDKTAKPAVSFGGKYRIIDFTLSNCSNSGIRTVGVLTQYRPTELSEYIGSGRPWDLDTSRGGVFILPPYLGRDGGAFYSGTADSIYRNLEFIRRYGAKYVLVLSGDHIYKMDYGRMIAEHKRRGAEVTVATVEVPLGDASRFGILETDDDLFVNGFEEKPKAPRSTTASMGVYVFTFDVLDEYLARDAADESSSHDFGKNVIPALVKDGAAVLSYPFYGYWRDVGTVDSLWRANMDLINEDSGLDVREVTWRVMTGGDMRPPEFVGADADVRSTIVSDGSFINGEVKNSVISRGAAVGRGAKVRYSVLMEDVRVESGAVVEYAVVCPGTVVREGVQVIGKAKSEWEPKEIALYRQR